MISNISSDKINLDIRLWAGPLQPFLDARMKSFFHSLWHRLLHDLGLQRPARRTYQLDEPFADVMQSLARHEQRSMEDVTAELLSSALAQRYNSSETIRLWETLSSREQQVVALSCLGYDNPEIARRLFISQQTVKSHVHRAVKKFGLKTKPQLLRVLRDFDFSAWESPHLDG